MNHKKLTKKELHQLKVDMLKNILSVVGGVHYNRYKNFKRKGKNEEMPRLQLVL